MSVFKSSKNVVKIEGADYRKKGARFFEYAEKRCKEIPRSSDRGVWFSDLDL